MASNRVVHPFLLADNRHYTFYLWRLMSRHNWAILYALIPFYMAAAWCCWQALGNAFPPSKEATTSARCRQFRPLHLRLPFFAFTHLLATEQTILWIVIYSVATALTLIPSPLLEFRYFIVPYLVYRLSMRQPRGAWLFLEFLLYVALNAFTIWMFLQRPFQGPREEGMQRFMW